ncbi:hypothetical protein [Acidihalobacter ferrooxydans]|uniref:Uncharacterized protein n=1 Tax=Acidihalobacter ferrooxydans TaxID=1765967 RepID=A0A1P8UDE0_9GAMM|nr:hypothetical protein [Acidihalobacter ferrooxydans]APZ41850.1 hypothetical protein BW247_01010 [Acidihalobacter ferrooxydans]
MIPRLPTRPLEHAINDRVPLETLCGGAGCALLDGLRVADYVGDYRMRQSRYGEHDLIGASAQVFFEDDGAFIARHEGAALSRDYAVVIFATFLVIEFNAFTPDAHFLVLAPALAADDGARYQGLWAAQRIERLQLALSEPGAEAELFASVDRLLDTLNRAPDTAATQKPRRGNWLTRLLGRH